MIWIAFGLLAVAFAWKCNSDWRAERIRRVMLGGLLMRAEMLEAALAIHASAINELCAVLEIQFRKDVEAIRERLKPVLPESPPPDETKH